MAVAPLSIITTGRERCLVTTTINNQPPQVQDSVSLRPCSGAMMTRSSKEEEEESIEAASPHDTILPTSMHKSTLCQFLARTLREADNRIKMVSHCRDYSLPAPLIVGHLNPPVSSFCWIHRPRDHEPSHTRIRIKRCLNSRFVVERTKDHTVIRLHYSDDDCT